MRQAAAALGKQLPCGTYYEYPTSHPTLSSHSVQSCPELRYNAAVLRRLCRLLDQLSSALALSYKSTAIGPSHSDSLAYVLWYYPNTPLAHGLGTPDDALDELAH